MSFIFTYSRNAVTVFLGGIPKVVNNTHPKWDDILAIVTGKAEATEAELATLVDTRQQVQKEVDKANFGRVTVGTDCILLDGKPVHNHLAVRMLEMVKAGINVGPWARFMEKLVANPSRTAVNELYLWLEQSGMPITENGNFLAYKKVAKDYTSYHKNADGSLFKNPVGVIVSMPRNEVDDNRNNTCSQGLHFCSYSYLPSYYGSEGRVLIVEIDPADVVSIPSDYNNAKGRAWRYLIRGEVERESAQFAFSGVLVADNSVYEDEWGGEVEEEEFDGWDSDFDLEFNEDGYVADIEELKEVETDWTRGVVTSNIKGGFCAYLTNDDGCRLLAVYDTTMELVSARRV